LAATSWEERDRWVFPLLELIGQARQLDLHLLDGLDRIVRADDVVADAILR
jgi:hypothetical protein